MITKREKLQYGYLFLIDLLSLVLSIGLAWGLTAGVLHKMGDFQLDDLVEACFLLLLAYILTFFTFDQSENIVNRTPVREVEIAVPTSAITKDFGFSFVILSTNPSSSASLKN